MHREVSGRRRARRPDLPDGVIRPVAVAWVVACALVAAARRQAPVVWSETVATARSVGRDLAWLVVAFLDQLIGLWTRGRRAAPAWLAARRTQILLFVGTV